MLDFIGEIFPSVATAILGGFFTIAMMAMVRNLLRAGRRGEQEEEAATNAEDAS